MCVSHGACENSRSEFPFSSQTHFSSRENTILRSKLAPRVGVSHGEMGDTSEDDDDSDDTSSTGYQDHEQAINHKLGLDPGRIYVIPNAVVTDKFKPPPRKQSDKGTNQWIGNGHRTNFVSYNRRAFSTRLPQRNRSISSSRSTNLREVPPRSLCNRCALWESDPQHIADPH